MLNIQHHLELLLLLLLISRKKKRKRQLTKKIILKNYRETSNSFISELMFWPTLSCQWILLILVFNLKKNQLRFISTTKKKKKQICLL